MDEHLERARAELQAASEDASRVIEQQLHSIDEGIFEEEAGSADETDDDVGDRTRDEPGPKVDRIVELNEKLQGLEDEAEGPTAERIGRARESVQAYLKAHPHGG